MAIFKKLNIGDVVATSGTRAFRKLTTAEVTPEDPTLPIWNGTDLTGTVWVLNDTLDIDLLRNISTDDVGIAGDRVKDYCYLDVNFIGTAAGGTTETYTRLGVYTDILGNTGLHYANVDSESRPGVFAYVDGQGWEYSIGSYQFHMSKGIEITGGLSATNPRLIDWLLQNAKLTSHQRMPKLAAPTISLDGDFILITNNNNVTRIKYNLYVDGELKTTVSRTIVYAIDLRGCTTELGTHDIFVVAASDGYEDSNPSNTVKYVYKEYTIPAGAYVFNEVLPYIGVYDGGLVTHYVMWADADTTLFTSNGTAYNNLDIAAAYGGKYYMYYSYLYTKSGSTSTYTKYADNAYCYGLDDYANGWQNENMRTINILRDVTHRSNTLNEWWVANTTKIS